MEMREERRDREREKQTEARGLSVAIFGSSTLCCLHEPSSRCHEAKAEQRDRPCSGDACWSTTPSRSHWRTRCAHPKDNTIVGGGGIEYFGFQVCSSRSGWQSSAIVWTILELQPSGQSSSDTGFVFERSKGCPRRRAGGTAGRRGNHDEAKEIPQNPQSTIVPRCQYGHQKLAGRDSTTGWTQGSR